MTKKELRTIATHTAGGFGLGCLEIALTGMSVAILPMRILVIPVVIPIASVAGALVGYATVVKEKRAHIRKDVSAKLGLKVTE